MGARDESTRGMRGAGTRRGVRMGAGEGRPSRAPRWRAATGDAVRRREPEGPAAKHRALPRGDTSVERGGGENMRSLSRDKDRW